MTDETHIDQPVPTIPDPAPTNRSTGALVLFLLLAIFMPICSFMYHFTLWSMEQSAIASGSLSNLAWFGQEFRAGAVELASGHAVTVHELVAQGATYTAAQIRRDARLHETVR